MTKKRAPKPIVNNDVASMPVRVKPGDADNVVGAVDQTPTIDPPKDWYELVFRVGNEQTVNRYHISQAADLLVQAATRHAAPAKLNWSTNDDGQPVGTVAKDRTRRYTVRPMVAGFVVVASDFDDDEALHPDQEALREGQGGLG